VILARARWALTPRTRAEVAAKGRGGRSDRAQADRVGTLSRDGIQHSSLVSAFGADAVQKEAFLYGASARVRP
jgi:hypothetical protein